METITNNTQPIGLVIGMIILFAISFYLKIKLPPVTKSTRAKDIETNHSEAMCTRVEVVVEKRTIGIVNPDQEVPVTLGWNLPAEVIGVAKVRLQEGELIASMTIYHDNISDELEEKPNYIKGLYPSIGGKIEEMSEEGDVSRFRLIGVALHPEPNADPTIKAL